MLSRLTLSVAAAIALGASVSILAATCHAQPGRTPADDWYDLAGASVTGFSRSLDHRLNNPQAAGALTVDALTEQEALDQVSKECSEEEARLSNALAQAAVEEQRRCRRHPLGRVRAECEAKAQKKFSEESQKLADRLWQACAHAKIEIQDRYVKARAKQARQAIERIRGEMGGTIMEMIAEDIAHGIFHELANSDLKRYNEHLRHATRRLELEARWDYLTRKLEDGLERANRITPWPNSPGSGAK